jgi:hypothetical protein
MESDVTQVRVGGEPSGFWDMVVIGLATGLQVVSHVVRAWVWNVLVLTYLPPSCYYKRKQRKREGEADGEKGTRVLCLLNCFLLSRGIVSFGAFTIEICLIIV